MPRSSIYLFVLVLLLSACTAANPSAVTTPSQNNTANTGASIASNPTTPTSPPTLAATIIAVPTDTATVIPSAIPSTTDTPTDTPSATGTISSTEVSATTDITSTTTVTATDITSTATVTVTATDTATIAPPPVAPPAPPPAPPGPAVLTSVVSNQPVTGLYVNEAGDVYYGVANGKDNIDNPLGGGYSLWKKPANGSPMQISPSSYNAIAGIVVHNGTIYFNEARALRRMPDDGQLHQADVVIRFPTLSTIYGHVNSALISYPVGGQDAVLMSVGSTIDSNYVAVGQPRGWNPPQYEPFPTGRIDYATFAWLDATKNFQATQGAGGQFDEYARGVRNPWAMTAGVVNGAMHILAVDNDPAFIPEKNPSQPGATNSGDELNDIVRGANYGHPFLYGGNEPALGDTPPVARFLNGSVPSGVAIAAGKVFVSLWGRSMIVEVNIATGAWRPVITNIQPFNLYARGNLLYVADYGGIRVIDARGF
ncbi:MAG: hypothetical protein WCF84_03180 [Anaerolineae bacterium]